MSSEHHTLDIFILDKAYKIACPPAEQDNLQRAAQFLDRKMREIRGSGKVLGLERIAVIAALNISHELLSRQQAEHEPHVSSEAMAGLLKRLETALAEDTSST